MISFRQFCEVFKSQMHYPYNNLGNEVGTKFYSSLNKEETHKQIVKFCYNIIKLLEPLADDDLSSAIETCLYFLDNWAENPKSTDVRQINKVISELMQLDRRFSVSEQNMPLIIRILRTSLEMIMIKSDSYYEHNQIARLADEIARSAAVVIANSGDTSGNPDLLKERVSMIYNKFITDLNKKNTETGVMMNSIESVEDLAVFLDYLEEKHNGAITYTQDGKLQLNFLNGSNQLSVPIIGNDKLDLARKIINNREAIELLKSLYYH